MEHLAGQRRAHTGQLHMKIDDERRGAAHEASRELLVRCDARERIPGLSLTGTHRGGGSLDRVSGRERQWMKLSHSEEAKEEDEGDELGESPRSGYRPGRRTDERAEKGRQSIWLQAGPKL